MSLSGNRLSTALCAGVGALLWQAAAGALAPAGSFFTNSLGMEFARMAAGIFTMGANVDPRLADTDGRSYDEQPAHQVKLTQPFYILKSEVSQADYQRAGLGGSAADVSWNQATAFCEWLSRRERRPYRLPTEAEWEYAVKVGQPR